MKWAYAIDERQAKMPPLEGGEMGLRERATTYLPDTKREIDGFPSPLEGIVPRSRK